MLAKNWEYFL